MFKCAVTGKTSNPGEPVIRVIIEIRPKTYENIVYDDRGKGEVIFSKGWEIVRELCVTKEGLDLLKAIPQ